MPTTARQHFNEDIARAQALYDQGVVVLAKNPDLAGDLFRSGVAAGVGSMDAYLCDAYVDCLTRALRSCSARGGPKLPSGYAKELLPAGPLVSKSYTKRVNWSLRMAARGRMEKDNLLQISRVKKLLNPSLPTGHKLWNDLAPKYIAVDRIRLTGISKADFSTKTGKAKDKAKQQAAAALLKRVGTIVQRRHDIVHNCDRPKSALQGLTRAAAQKMLLDIKSFVTILDDHVDQHRVF